MAVIRNVAPTFGRKLTPVVRSIEEVRTTKMAELRRFPKLRSLSLISLFLAGCMYVPRTDPTRAKEAMLKEDLYSMRQAIDQYTQDKNKAPQHLENLVDAGYLHAIPKDPFTNTSDSWQPVQEDVMTTLDQIQRGITDVHSGSKQVSSEGTPYSSW